MDAIEVLYILTGAKAIHKPRLGVPGEYDPGTNTFGYSVDSREVFSHELGHAFYHRANRSLGFRYVGRENEIFARACENLDLAAGIEDAGDLVRLGFEDWRKDGAYYYLRRGMLKEPYSEDKLVGYSSSCCTLHSI